MGFSTKIDYSRQLIQPSGDTATFSGNTNIEGLLWVGLPQYVTDGSDPGYNGNSGYTFIVQYASDNDGVSNFYSDGRISTYGMSVTAFSGKTTGNTVVAISQPPLIPVDTTAATISITASCLQINSSNLISASATDLGIDSLGNIVKDTSSLRYKYNVNDLTFSNLNKLLDLKPKNFKWRSNHTDDWGYIAEDVHNLGLTDLVSYEGGVPDSVKYKKLSIMLIEYLKIYITKENDEEFIVLTENGDYVLNRETSKKYTIKSLSECRILPDIGLIDNNWDSLRLTSESSVGLKFYEPLNCWLIVSSDGIKNT
jgi:hypothetical protein